MLRTTERYMVLEYICVGRRGRAGWGGGGENKQLERNTGRISHAAHAAKENRAFSRAYYKKYSPLQIKGVSSSQAATGHANVRPWKF